MGSVVEDLEKKQLLKLAEYFSKQTWPRIPFKGDPKRVSNGERAANSGQCVACHLGSYTVLAASVGGTSLLCPAAHISAVRLFPYVLLTSIPISRIARTISTKPLPAA